MDSWTLQGDSYSFLHSAPRTFSLCHRDGTPNHVEIFDIINVPSQRSAISETTCLCDIFGDDCEPPSLASSPAVGAFVPSQREVDGAAAASPLVDDLNDSSGSYHTAHGSSEGEEGFEDSRERICSPPLQNEHSERRQTGGKRLSSNHPDISEDSSPDLKTKSRSPLSELNRASPPSEILNTVERTPSPGYNSPYTFSSEGRVSSLSSSSVEKRCSPSSPNSNQTDSETEQRNINPTFKDRSSTPLHNFLTPSPSSENRNCVSSSSTETFNIKSSPELIVAQLSFEPSSRYFNQDSSPSPEPTSRDFSLDLTESAFESRAILSSPLPSSNSAELSSQSRDSLVYPELKNRSDSPDRQTSSPFPELRGRVSVPDLFSRCSTPDREDTPCSSNLIPEPCSVEINTTTTPENQNARLSSEPVSTVSSPAPQFTPSSPVIPIATINELVENSVSPELRHKTPSPGLLSADAPSKTAERITSPKIRHILTPENRAEVSLPVVSYSLSPSPEVRSSGSPIEHQYTAPSPEIRIISSSPKVSRRERSSEVEKISSSPLLEPHFDSTSPRSLASSPHITGISYTVVQPEDRDSPPFPELCHFSTPEPDRAHVSSETRSPSRDSLQSSIVDSSGASRDSPHISGFTSSVLQPEVTPSHHQRCKTPSPQPKHHTHSPELNYHQTPFSGNYQSPSPQHSSRDPSPAAPSTDQRSRATLSTECNFHFTQPNPVLRNTPEAERDFSAEKQYPTHLEEVNESPSFELGSEDKSDLADIKISSPVQVVQSPVCTSPVLPEVKADSSLKQQSIEKKATSTEVQDKSLALLSKKKQDTGLTCFQKQGTYNNPITDIKSLSPDHLVSEDKKLNISSVNRATSSPPVQQFENPQPQLNTYSPTSESRSPLKSLCTPEHLRRQLSTKVRSENRERFTDDMAHHVNRRRTPSPPLTRFTPVHIVAPEKPYRQWQNRNCSPSQVVTSLHSSNLKKETNRESPNAPTDNNSHDHWVKQEKQLEMERERLLEEKREVGRVMQRDREMERERKREEQVPEKGVGWQSDTGYRGEQVELSFNARNRKGPASWSTAPTSRETRQGLPTVHSYPESLLATRQLQQQQRLVRLASQQDIRGSGPSKRLQPPVPQSKNSAPGPVAASRPCRSSSSSMGSEIDEADNEVKWLTDLAFRSLSSPEADYLDMYNSSHCSSTNISQPSTQESPAGINAAWLAYADFKGSASKLDNDELSFQQPSAHYSGGLDPSRRYEMGSFECVDVAVEREDTRKVRRGVPKRQIQLKRKNNHEGKHDESSENSSPGVPVMLESPSLDSQSRETFMRQHSTPAAFQEYCPSGGSPEPNQQNERKSKLQKSISLDESCSKTKIATCLIKSVLSKKMQNVDQNEDEVSPAFEENSPPPESTMGPLKESPKPATHNQSSSLQADCSISSVGLPVKGEPRPKDEVKPLKSFGVRSSSRPSSSSSSRSVNFSQTDSEEADSQNTNEASLRSEMKSELKVPFDIKRSRTGVQQEDGSKSRNKREGGESANTTTGNTGAVSAIGARQQMTNRDQECENTEDHKQLQQCAYMSNAQEITLKAVEKKKASLNVCLTPEAVNKPEASSPDISFREKGQMTENSVDNTDREKTDEEEGDGNNKVKVPIHKVRDVRRLVKNTYNLSFKAANAVLSSDAKKEVIENINEERREAIKEERQEEIIPGQEREISQEMWKEESREKRETEFTVERKSEVNEKADSSPSLQSKGQLTSRSQPMQIEYKAICCKEDKNKMSCCKKDLENPVKKLHASPKLVTGASRELQKSATANTQNHTTGDSAIAKSYQHDLSLSAETQETMTEIHKAPVNDDKSVAVRTDRKPPMIGSLPKLPSKEREVSTAVVLIRDGSSKTKASSSLPHEENPTPIQDPASSPSPCPITPGSTPGNSGHSVSMLLKEKGYQADIGAVMGDSQNATGSKGVPHKHVNCLEIPLQSDGGQNESNRERTFSSSSNTSGPSAVSDNTDTLTKNREGEGLVKPTVKDIAKQKSASPLRNIHEQTSTTNKQKELSDFESVKRLDPTFPPRSPAIRRFRPQPIEVKSLSKETQKQEMPANPTGNNKPQTIEVKSIAKSSQKPVVPPKPSCKFKPADVGVMSPETQRLSTSTVKPQGEERPQTIVVSSPTIYRKISNESMSTSSYPRKLAVSAVSSLKPPPSKATATTISSLSNQSMAPSEREATIDRGQQHHQASSPQSSRYTQKQTPLSKTPTSVSSPGAEVNSAPQPGAQGPAAEVNSTPRLGAPSPASEVNSAPEPRDEINAVPGPRADVNSAPSPVSDPTGNQDSGLASATANQPSQSTIMDPVNEPQYPSVAQEQAMAVTSNTTKQPAAVSTTVPGYTHQHCRRSLSSGRSQRTDDLHFYASDDPPSYDERESFSPLILPDLTPRRSNRYQPSSRPPPCSCTAGCPSHPGPTPPHHHRSPHNLTPPAPPHSPGQALPYPFAQPPVRPHQCRPDHQPMNYQPSSPKSSPLGPSHPPALYQPLHQPPPCPPHPSLMQACPADRPLQPSQHIDARRPPAHRSPQHQPPSMAGAPYSDTAHGHSPGLPPMDPQYLCGPPSLGPSYGSEYGGDNSSLYSESSYGQTPRKVLMDPETGKYFYIEVPVQPLRKMLFDPETGQYVEVLIPQQAMSHSGLYPPSAAPYPSLHNPNIYAPAPQYMPYAAPPPAAHPPGQPQPPRYAEAPAAATMHPSVPGVSYRNPSGQGSKPESQNHPPLDQNYLESMYYVPTGMNASPNHTPPDYYHRRPPNLPPAGGKRS